jgi:hypothetical protein
MYYVIRKNEGLSQWHSRYDEQSKAREHAEHLKKTFRHDYDVIKVATVWTTQTIEEAMS